MARSLIPLELCFSFAPQDSLLFNAFWKLGYEIAKRLGSFPDWSFLADMISTLGKVKFYSKR